MAYRPLADEIRPKTLDEVVGQKHILGKDGLLRRIIEGGDIPNLIFYGPSGTGKTTVANIIAQRTNRPLHRLNATTASISDIKDIIADIGTLLAPDGVLLYLDEIQYFNKKQQQSLLEFMENGKITLIASTTENPFFYVFGAVLSRSTVFEFKQITAESDPDAAVHYLARLLEAGDLITAIRRLLCSASEDVGLAYPQAVPIVKACVDSALQLGLPEAKLPLSEAAILLATWPKSNSACMAIDAAMADVRAGRTGDIPRELQNVHADSAGMEREQGYLYPHDFPGHWVKQQYLPNELKNRKYYQYGDNKTEQAARRYWEEIKK